MEVCVIVPSHISNASRTKMLINCLQSLINQTYKIQIYLSISFETDLDKILFNAAMRKNNLVDNHSLNIIQQQRKTSQFGHIENVVNQVKNLYKYVMFCDDDDTYDLNRVIKFILSIQHGLNHISTNKIFAGVYDTHLQEGDHNTIFHEYWSYCVDINLVTNFFDIIRSNSYDRVIDNKMCDVLFAMYLRSLDDNYVFISVREKLYNYNRNIHSVTGQIRQMNKEKNKFEQYVERDFSRFIQDMNRTLEENMVGNKNNIFINHSVALLSFEENLELILQENYKYVDYVDERIIEELKVEYDNIKALCKLLYQQKHKLFE